MALAPVVYCLWQRVLRFDPSHPIWPSGRQYLYVPVSAHATTYRPTVQRFDKVILEGQAPQGPLTDAHES